jgi:hypothetical protein
MLTRTVLLFAALGALFRGMGAAPTPPLHFYDEARFRHLTLTQAEFGRFKVDIRFVGGPGECSKWEGSGTKKEKEFVFSRNVGEEENRGTVYIGTGGESRFLVKLKPKQEKALQDEGIVGEYRHVTEEKRFQLAKKELEAADKRLMELFKTMGKTLKGDDKPIAAEFKQRWPALRDRIMSLAYKAPAPAATTTKPPLGASPRTDDASADKNPDRLWAMVEADSAEIGFVSGQIDPKVKETFDGDYNDGFGGSLSIYQNAQSGDVRFTLNCNRGADAQTGELTGAIPAKPIRKDAPTDGWLDYTHKDEAVPDASKQIHIRLKRVGHYVIVESERNASKAWFDGIYRKQPPAVE